MSSSTTPLDFCLVISLQGAAQWLTPAQAQRLCDAIPMWSVLDEIDKNFEAYAKLAGPKPIVLMSDEYSKPGVK